MGSRMNPTGVASGLRVQQCQQRTFGLALTVTLDLDFLELKIPASPSISLLLAGRCNKRRAPPEKQAQRVERRVLSCARIQLGGQPSADTWSPWGRAWFLLDSALA